MTYFLLVQFLLTVSSADSGGDVGITREEPMYREGQTPDERLLPVCQENGCQVQAWQNAEQRGAGYVGQAADQANRFFYSWGALVCEGQEQKVLPDGIAIVDSETKRPVINESKFREFIYEENPNQLIALLDERKQKLTEKLKLLEAKDPKFLEEMNANLVSLRRLITFRDMKMTDRKPYNAPDISRRYHPPSEIKVNPGSTEGTPPSANDIAAAKEVVQDFMDDFIESLNPGLDSDVPPHPMYNKPFLEVPTVKGAGVVKKQYAMDGVRNCFIKNKVSRNDTRKVVKLKSLTLKSVKGGGRVNCRRVFNHLFMNHMESEKINAMTQIAGIYGDNPLLLEIENYYGANVPVDIVKGRARERIKTITAQMASLREILRDNASRASNEANKGYDQPRFDKNFTKYYCNAKEYWQGYLKQFALKHDDSDIKSLCAMYDKFWVKHCSENILEKAPGLVTEVMGSITGCAASAKFIPDQRAKWVGCGFASLASFVVGDEMNRDFYREKIKSIYAATMMGAITPEEAEAQVKVLKEEMEFTSGIGLGAAMVSTVPGVWVARPFRKLFAKSHPRFKSGRPKHDIARVASATENTALSRFMKGMEPTPENLTMARLLRTADWKVRQKMGGKSWSEIASSDKLLAQYNNHLADIIEKRASDLGIPLSRENSQTLQALRSGKYNKCMKGTASIDFTNQHMVAQNFCK